MIITAWASIVGTKLHSADVSNAYFQSEPLDRVFLLRQPRGGLPQVDPNAALLVRVPVYGLTDSGRSFWLRLSSDAKKAGLTPSRPSIIYPAFFYKLDGENRCVAMLTTHVDDLLYSYLPEAKEVMDVSLSSYELPDIFLLISPVTVLIFFLWRKSTYASYGPYKTSSLSATVSRTLCF